MTTAISLGNLVTNKNIFKRMLITMLDNTLGISAMNKIYQHNNMAGMSKEAFAQKLLDVLNVQIDGIDQLNNKIPKTGPVVIAANHPFGGLEGVFLCLLIGKIRPDLKVLANEALQIFPELSEYFIFTNPLSERDPKNGPSLRTSMRHVKQGGALMIFPAGRVSYFREDKKRISEHEWNRILSKLIHSGKADYVPLFISGENSKWFYRLGRIDERLRMLRLGHELLNKRDTRVQISCGTAVPANKFASAMGDIEHTALCRIQSYCQDPIWQQSWPPQSAQPLQPLVSEVSGDVLQQQLAQLPATQLLYEQSEYQVFYGYQTQMPEVVSEIARLREQVFREHNEGSGEARDSDEFDASYTHLLIFNQQQKRIIGAYRMGQTDKILPEKGLSGLYLSRMFDFSGEFVNQQQACLEMGRSFIIPEYQRSTTGLYMLWRGIGAFIQLFPQYHTLYGTVSISKLYDKRSVTLIEKALVTPTQAVSAKQSFEAHLHPELTDFAEQYSLREHLSALISCIEPDGKTLPVLLKQYARLGAQFHCMGIDPNFNQTPGLLLSVDLHKAPSKVIKRYLGDAFKGSQLA